MTKEQSEEFFRRARAQHEKNEQIRKHNEQIKMMKLRKKPKTKWNFDRIL